MADFSITGEVRLNSDPAEKSVSKWTVAAGNMIADFAKKAAQALASVVQSGIEYNAGMESYLANFRVMLGDAELAAAKLEEIRRMAASTPFSVSDLTAGTQTLLQFGIAADGTTAVLQRLGDISLGNADKLQTLTRAYGKMSSAQKVTLENVNMMIDAGFNPLNQICAATGETMSELYQRISDGKVSFNELEAAVISATSEGGQFFNGMAEASQTFNGRLSTMTDNAKRLVGALTEAFYDGQKALMESAIEWVQILQDTLEAEGPGAMLEAGVEIVLDFLEGVVDALPGVVNAGIQAATDFIAGLINRLPEIAEAGGHIVGKLSSGVLSVAASLASAAVQLITTFVVQFLTFEWVDVGVSIVKGILEGFLDTLPKLAQTVKDAVASIIQAAKNALSSASDNVIVPVTKTSGNSDPKNLEQERQRRKQLHDERVRQAQEEAAALRAVAGAAEETEETITGSTEKTVKDVTDDLDKVEAAVERTVTSTTSALVDGVQTTTKIITETLTDGTTRTRQTITEVQDEVVDGALVTVERVRTIAADGTETVAETIRESACTSFSGLWDALQARAEEGVLGTFGTLYTAVKQQDWLGVGKWAAGVLYDGLSADQKKRVSDFALGLVDQLNSTLAGAQSQLAQSAWNIGESIYSGIVRGFPKILEEAGTLADALQSTFKSLKGPLAAAAKAISSALSSGLLASFPAIYAGFASLIGTIGAAVEGMLAAVAAALSSTVFGIPAGLVVAAAAAVLAGAIAVIVSRLGGSSGGSSSTISSPGSGSGGGNGGPGGDMDLDADDLEDAIRENTEALTKTNSALADMVRRANALVLSDNMRMGSTAAASGTAQIRAAADQYHTTHASITQNIYSKAQTAADLQREARWEADKALAQKR
ncbi:MAG: tape measure protein [Faecalibacterium sp.]